MGTRQSKTWKRKRELANLKALISFISSVQLQNFRLDLYKKLDELQHKIIENITKNNKELITIDHIYKIEDK